MATFTISLNADETKSGAFSATVRAGDTITLAADSAARAVIVPVTFPFVGPTPLLSTDNNEGVNGDYPGIGNGSISWTVPPAAGASATVFVHWVAYNWKGPGSITLDGFSELGKNQVGEGEGEGEGENSSTLILPKYAIRRFIPEGGTKRVDFYYEGEPTTLKIGFDNQAKEYFEFKIDRIKGNLYSLVITCKEVPDSFLYHFAGKLFYIRMRGEEIAVAVDYAIGNKTWDIERDASGIPYAQNCFRNQVELTTVSAQALGEPNWVHVTMKRWEVFYDPDDMRPKQRRVVCEGNSAELDYNEYFSIECSIDENNTGVDREAFIELKPANSARSTRIYKVTQRAQTNNSDPVVEIIPSSIVAPSSGGHFFCDLRTNAATGEVVHSQLPDWFDLEGEEGILLVDVSGNTGGTRAETIIFSGKNGGNATLEVSQEALQEPQILINPEKLHFPACGDLKRVTISANSETGAVNVANIENWIEAYTDGTIHIAENTQAESRTGVVVFYGELGGSAVLEVSQDAYTEDASIQVSPETLEFSPVGGMQHVDIVTSGNAGEVQISTEADWLMVDADANVIAAANLSTQAREARIEFRGGNMPTGTGASVTVTQAGARKLPAAFYRGTRAK